jgi:hypothetical protein
MFRCEGEDRLIDKIIKTAENHERLKEESAKKLAQLQASPKSRVNRGGISLHESSYQSPRGADQVKGKRNMLMSGGSDAPLSSAFSKNVPGNYT